MVTMGATVEIVEHDGTYTAIDTETGAAGSGRSKALVVSAAALGGGVSHPADGDSAEALEALSARVLESGFPVPTGPRTRWVRSA